MIAFLYGMFLNIYYFIFNIFIFMKHILYLLILIYVLYEC